jgi:hypothetical protein
LKFEGSIALAFPPMNVVRHGMRAIKKFLFVHHHPLKMLFLILAARRRRMRHLPPELWVLIRDEFLSDCFAGYEEHDNGREEEDHDEEDEEQDQQEQQQQQDDQDEAGQAGD